MPIKVSCLLFCLMLLIAACSGGADQPQPSTAISFQVRPNPEKVAAGQAIYDARCAACHGPQGVGQNPEDPRAKDDQGRFLAPPHNQNGHTFHHDDDLLISIIKNGGMGDPKTFTEMPAFGESLTEQEINQVLAYIKTLWTDEQRAAQEQATKAVRSGS